MSSADSVLEEITKSISNLEQQNKVMQLVEKALEQKLTVVDIVEKALKPGLDEVGARYAKGEYFLAELLYAGDTVTDLFNVLKPRMKQDVLEEKGTIILGTVRGDVHSVGKTIFSMMAQFSGFKIHDLGVDVDPKRFVEEAKKTGAEILGLSTLLTTTLPEVKVVVDGLIEADIRDKIKVIVGGNAVTKEFAEEVGADAAALDAVEGVQICKRWVAGN